ncbi:MAG: DUF3037 domain-containing protein [Actinomycetota bacterium]|nr:DUF3037 domain-containing protein [Actinomycetota bacterium]
MSRAERSPFSYALLRVVPRVERGERFNVGVVLFCRQRDFLAAKVMLDRVRLSALTPLCPAEALEQLAGELEQRLATLSRVAAGDAEAGAIASLPASERFGWLAAPASTMVQPSAVHTGLCSDPAATLDDLFDHLVKRHR